MKLTVINPESSIEYQIAWLEIETPSGSLTIHRGHAPAIFPLVPYTQLVFKLKTGKQQTLTIQQGCIHINREHIEAFVNPAV